MISLLLGLQTPTADQVLARAAKLYRTTSQWAVKATSSSLELDVTVSRPVQALVRVKMPAKGSMAPSDRSYFFNANRLLAVDNNLQHLLKRTTVGQTLAKRIEGSVGAFDLPASIHLDPEVGFQLFERFRRSSPKLTMRGGISVVTIPGSDPASQIVFELEPTGRLRAMKISQKGKPLAWKFAYRQAGQLRWLPPAGIPQVESFVDVARSPRFEDSGAKATVERSFRVYDRLQKVKYRVNTDAEERSVEMTPKLVRQSGPEGSWAWDGRSATVRKKGGELKAKGFADITNLAARVAKNGGVVDETLRQILTRQNPVRRAFGPDLRVRSTGELVIDGKPCVAVEGNQKGVRVTALIRKSDALLARLTLENLDGRGGVVSRSDRAFRYP